MRFPLLSALSVLVLVPSLPAPVSDRRKHDGAIEQLVASGRHADLRWSDLRDVQPDLARLYERHGWAPIWLVDDTLTTPARAVVRILNEAEYRGLDPEDYDVSWFDRQLSVTRILGGMTEDSRARFDVAVPRRQLDFPRLRAGR